MNADDEEPLSPELEAIVEDAVRRMSGAPDPALRFVAGIGGIAEGHTLPIGPRDDDGGVLWRYSVHAKSGDSYAGAVIQTMSREQAEELYVQLGRALGKREQFDG